MLIIKIKKKNSIFFLFLFIFTIISSKTFASNKDLQDKNFFVNQLKISDNSLITKTNTKEWIKALNNDLYLLEQKININKDYLKLIKQFPSDKNIKEYDINQDLKKYKNEIHEYLESINALKRLYKILNLEENVDIYLVKYDFNFKKSGDRKFTWFSLCTSDLNYDKEISEIRKNLLQVFYFLDNTYYLSRKNLISYSNKLGLSESKLDKFVCKEFIENKLKKL